MNERALADTLDRLLDDLTPNEHDAAIDPELERIARRYQALGWTPAPIGARERVRHQIASNHPDALQNGQVQTRPGESIQRFLKRPSSQLPDAVVFPSPRLPSPIAPPALGSPWSAWRAMLSLAVLLAFAAGALLLNQTFQRTAPIDTIPAATISSESPSSAVTVSLPRAGEDALFVVDLPAGMLPAPAFGATFDQRTMPPRSETTDDAADAPLLRYVVSGQVAIRATAPMHVIRTGGDGAAEEIPAESDYDLHPGDAIFLSAPAAITYVNQGDAPVNLIAWSMTADGGGNSEVPDGWSLQDNVAIHMAHSAQTAGQLHLQLRRIELAPGELLAPPPAALIAQTVFLDTNAAGERVARMIGTMGDGSRKNAGRQALTVFEVIVLDAD